MQEKKIRKSCFYDFKISTDTEINFYVVEEYF